MIIRYTTDKAFPISFRTGLDTTGQLIIADVYHIGVGHKKSVNAYGFGQLGTLTPWNPNQGYSAGENVYVDNFIFTVKQDIGPSTIYPPVGQATVGSTWVIPPTGYDPNDAHPLNNQDSFELQLADKVSFGDSPDSEIVVYCDFTGIDAGENYSLVFSSPEQGTLASVPLVLLSADGYSVNANVKSPQRS